ncbi:MAG: hypothetical protein ACUZ8H_13760 [Candidatus Anammoxibacter sp.]
MKVVMLESQGGVSFNRDIGSIWEIPDKEAKNLIEAGICRKAERQVDVIQEYKRKLYQINEELEGLKRINSNLKLELNGQKEKSGKKTSKKAGKKTS